MNRNDRQTFALLLVQVAVVLPKGSGRGVEGVQLERGFCFCLGFRFVFSSVRYSSVHLSGLWREGGAAASKCISIAYISEVFITSQKFCISFSLALSFSLFLLRLALCM